MVFYFRFICVEELGKAKFSWEKYYNVCFCEKPGENSGNTYENTFYCFSSEAGVPMSKKGLICLYSLIFPLENSFPSGEALL